MLAGEDESMRETAAGFLQIVGRNGQGCQKRSVWSTATSR